MRFLVELGSPESVNYTVFCCSHVILAFFMFLVLDTTLTLWCFGFELFVTYYHDYPDHVWVLFYGVSLVSLVSGGIAICDVPVAILIYGCRLLAILATTGARFLVSIRDISSSDTPKLREMVNLFQMVPLLFYTIGILLVVRLFSYSTGRYRGYHDVDVNLRKEVKRRFVEFEASKMD